MRPAIENTAMRCASLIAVAAVLAAHVCAAAPTGPEFQVNSSGLGDQGYPSACMSGPDAVVAWESRGAASAVLTRRFAAGAPTTDEVVLDALDAGTVQAPAVACAGDGSYVVVWERREGEDFDIAARRLAADGEPLSPPLLVNGATGRQRGPAVCNDGAGNFVVAWQSDGQDGDGYAIVARRVGADGAPRGDEWVVNQTSPSSQQHPAIACEATGGFAIAWESRGQDGDGGAIVARRYDSGGAGGDERQLNTTVAGDQRLPAIAAVPGGGFVVAWESEGQDGDESGIFGRRLAADLAPLGDEMQVNSAAIYSQEQPAVAVSGDEVVIAWSSPGDGDGYGVFARRFAADGTPRGAEALVNVATAGVQGAVSDEGGGLAATGDAAGTLLVAWQSLRLTGSSPDGDGMGVFARAGLPPDACAGDCDGDGDVAIDELIRGVGLALGDGSAAECAALDADGDDRVVIAELIAAVAAALNGCDNG